MPALAKSVRTAATLLITSVLVGACSMSQPISGPGWDIGKPKQFHYVRSNRDGTEPEDVYIYQPSDDTLEVYKSRGDCGNAAFVTANVSLVSGSVRKMSGGRLEPGGGHTMFAFLTYDWRKHLVEVQMLQGEAVPVVRTLEIPDPPWHLFDFDLASLTVSAPYVTRPRQHFSFGLARAWSDAQREDFLTYLGRIDALYQNDEPVNERNTLRYRLDRDGEVVGNLWLDAQGGYIARAELDLPNHLGYRDFRLELVSVGPADEAAWRALLEAHYAGCDAS